MTALIVPASARVRRDRRCAGPKCCFRKEAHGDQCSCYLGLLDAAQRQYERECDRAANPEPEDDEPQPTATPERVVGRKNKRRIEAGQGSLF